MHLPGGMELVIIAGIVLLLFGGAKVPQLMKGLGEGMREFKKATHEDEVPPTPPTSMTNQNDPRV